MIPFSSDYAAALDAQDSLVRLRSRFLIPQRNGRDAIYFCGNSLGLQPRAAMEALRQELEDWALLGVDGYTQAQTPWLQYHRRFSESLAAITGALSTEVVAMNALTVNLHLLLSAFYRPTPQRFRILFEHKAFPSDVYALKSQIRIRGLDPDAVLREISPREGEHVLHEEDILQSIREEGGHLALVLMGGINYYTGQVFDMEKITAAAHAEGGLAGFDLAHAVGNIELHLHDWRVDFAAWCSYKYLNSGPGAVAGVFIHENHCQNPGLVKLEGWWGGKDVVKFNMEPDFEGPATIESWQMSTAQVLPMSVHRAALDIFDEAGMSAIIAKSRSLSGYLETLLKEIQQMASFENMFSIITPPQRRGAQLSLLFHREGRDVFDYLTRNGVVADWRKPDVIRVAPAPLYNTYSEVYRFAEFLRNYRPA